VPKFVICDNLRAAATNPDRYEPGLNGSYLELADHGAVILPARPYKPRLRTDVVEDYERRGQEEVVALDAKMRRHILALAEQFPRIWADPRIDVREQVPEGATVTATIGIGPRSEGGFGITAALDVYLPGVPGDEAQKLV
jgi:hypothetical protein